MSTKIDAETATGRTFRAMGVSLVIHPRNPLPIASFYAGSIHDVTAEKQA
jgi:coproporphyrinogen III oxidase